MRGCRWVDSAGRPGPSLPSQQTLEDPACFSHPSAFACSRDCGTETALAASAVRCNQEDLMGAKKQKC